MSITLSPQTQAQLEAVAALRGLPPLDALDAVLAEARAAWEEWEQQDALAGVARSEADFAAGRHYSVEEVMARLDATIEAKRREREAREQKAVS